jgi:group II intron reverse transcriptase/maturase
MKRQKEIAYQMDLFLGTGKDVIPHSEGCETGSGAKERKGLQVNGANERKRAFTEDLMRVILSKDNLRRAYKQVKSNDGSPGIDGMTIREFKEWYPLHGMDLIQNLIEGKYNPLPVRGVEIDKPDGGKRKLGIPTVKDRFIQQAIYQVLNELYDNNFSPYSYGFRKGRNAHQAIKQASDYVKDGYEIVVDIDLEKFFDRVNHDRLMNRLSRDIEDKHLLRLIRRYLQSGIMLGGMVSQRIEGTPQGSPLSPLLSNIVLDELDKELGNRGHKFCRYADDCNIYVRSQKAGERVMESIRRFIEDTLKLKINRQKSKVCVSNQTKFLGYRVQLSGRLSVSPQNINRFKEKIRNITRRKRGVALQTIIFQVNNALRGWLNYFRYANLKTLLSKLDAWLRRRIRCFRLKQCKNTYTIYKFLRNFGVYRGAAWSIAGSGKGWWRLSGTLPVNHALNDAWFEKIGLVNMVAHFASLKTN